MCAYCSLVFKVRHISHASSFLLPFLLPVAQALLQLPTKALAKFKQGTLGSNYLIKDILQLVLRQRRALDVLDCAKFSRHPLAVFALYWGHPLLCQLIFYLGVLSKIYLRADDQARHSRAVMVDLWKPFLADVFEGRGGCYGEADEKDVGLRV